MFTYLWRHLTTAVFVRKTGVRIKITENKSFGNESDGVL